MEAQKIVIAHDGTAKIQCPNCNKAKVLPTTKLSGKDILKAKCSCKSVFPLRLEFRGKYRKETGLDGFFVKLFKKDNWGKIISQSTPTNSPPVNCKIKNISTNGVGLETSEKPNVKIGDLLKVEFTLDTSASPVIRKKVIVRGLKDNYIGCEFCDDEINESKIGSYVL